MILLNEQLIPVLLKILWLNFTYFIIRLVISFKLKRQKWNFFSLLGSIGGNMSLLMGVSIFSLFELIEVGI